MFLLLVTITHMLPTEFLGTLGMVSDHVSDISPEFMRGLEHLFFMVLLN